MKMVLWISSMHISVHIKSASKMFFFFSILEHWTSQLPINTCYVNIRSQCSEINKTKKITIIVLDYNIVFYLMFCVSK